MISFLRKHPKLLCFAISLLTSINSFVLRWLNWSMLLLINLKGLDPNPPPPPPPPEPTLTEVLQKKFSTRNKIYVGQPYVPKWVSKSLQRGGQSEHPINKQRVK